MDIHIEFGWWIFPTAITVVSFIAAWWPLRNETSQKGDYAAMGNALLGLAQLALFSIAAIVSLASWLIWSLAS